VSSDAEFKPKELKGVEVGFVEMHPLIYAWMQVLTILKTWRYLRKLGLPVNKWYGVYECGTDKIIALTGCTPQSHHYANLLAASENDFRGRNQASH